MSALFPLEIPPGVVRSGTEYQAKGRWYDAHMVRWYDGVALGPIPSFAVKSTSAMTGSPRAIITWRSNDGTRRAAIGTHSKLYAMSSLGALTDITPVGFTSGRADAATLLGYGKGPYGAYTYGSPRPDTGNALPATVWDLDIWGQYLVGCTADDGKLYEYQNTGVATIISNAPTSCQGLLVHPKRLLIALGAGGNLRKFQWSDLGDNTVWSPSATNQAGSNEVKRGKLVCARAVNDQALMLSDIEAHAVDYVGLPFVLVARVVGTDCGAISKGCMISSGSFAAWWSKSGFFIYDGAVRPLRCDVWDDLVRNLATAQQSKISGYHNSDNGEFWWFYPRAFSENTNYVIWNYRYDYWNVGEISRTAGCAPGVFIRPFTTTADGFVLEEETGSDWGNATPFARSGPIEIGNGDRRMHVLGIIPDELAENDITGDVDINFFIREYPNAALDSEGAFLLTSAGKTDVRFSARQVELYVRQASLRSWRWGAPRLLLAPAGKR